MTIPHPPFNTPLRSDLADDPDMGELIDAFVSEIPTRVDALKRALETKNATDLKRLAHQLKGAAGGYGYPSIGSAAGKVEALVVSLPTGGLDARLDAVRQELQRLTDLCQRAVAGRK